MCFLYVPAPCTGQVLAREPCFLGPRSSAVDFHQEAIDPWPSTQELGLDLEFDRMARQTMEQMHASGMPAPVCMVYAAHTLQLVC